LRRLTFELSGWPWWGGLPARRRIDSERLAGKAARRGQSALKRGVRPR